MVTSGAGGRVSIITDEDVILEGPGKGPHVQSLATTRLFQCGRTCVRAWVVSLAQTATSISTNARPIHAKTEQRA